jgi:GNAT superfamily N-acetyltransferase
MGESKIAAGYVLVEGYPSVGDYLHLRTASGLTPKNEEQAHAAIKGSWHGAYIAEEATPTKAVAMGRVIGDGGWYFLIADMVTLPDHQRKGFGDAILKNLLANIKSRAAEGRAYVTLGADPPGRKLYLKNGFKETMPDVMGMGCK